MNVLKENKKLRISLIVVIGLVLFMSIGYAAFTSKLNINGIGHVKGVRWSIHYVSNSVHVLTDTTDGLTNITGDSVTTPATINADLNDIAFEVGMDSNTKYEFTVDITNDGSYDGLVKTVLLTTTKGTNAATSTYDYTYTDGSVTYTVTYEDGTPIMIGDKLSKGETKTLKFSAKYVPVSDSAPTVDTDYKFSTSVEYTQSSGLPKGEEVSVPYRITYIPNGGTTTVTSKYVNRGEAIGTLPTPTKEGLAFQGWYSDEALTNRIEADYIPTSDMNLYAKYGGKYTLTINAENSKTVSADKIYISYGDSVGTFPTITYKGGFALEGWYTDASYTNQIDTTYFPSSDMTIYAKSKLDKTKDIYYYFNNYKFKSIGIDNILLVNSNIGTGTWNEADTKSKAFMPTYNSRLMKYSEWNGSNRTSFKNNTNWWLNDVSSSDAGSYRYVGTDGDTRYCGNSCFDYYASASTIYGIRPVIDVTKVSFVAGGGDGTSDNPYIITVK